MSTDQNSDDSTLDELAEEAREVLVDPVAIVAKTVWWLVLIRGIALVLFGAFAIFAPTFTLIATVIVFGVFALVDGIFGIAHAVRVRGRVRGWGWLLAQAIIAVLAGLVALILPIPFGIASGVFVLAMIGGYAGLTGAFGIPAAAGMAIDGGRKALAIVSSVLSLLLGLGLLVLIVANPAAAVLGSIWVAGVWAIISGVLLIVLAIQARTLRKGEVPGLNA